MVNKYSWSKVSSWNRCKQSYKLSRIDKLQPVNDTTRNMEFGSLMHDTLEQLFKQSSRIYNHVTEEITTVKVVKKSVTEIVNALISDRVI